MEIIAIPVIHYLLYCLSVARDALVNSTAFHPQWSHCAIGQIPGGGLDEGALQETACLFNKTSSDTAVKVSFNGNLRMTNCEDCCMRWFVTINGSKCVSPAPIEAVIYSTNARTINVHRGSTIAGEHNIDSGLTQSGVTVSSRVGPWMLLC